MEALEDVEERRKEIEEDSAFELFVHARRVDAPLTERLLKEKREAADLFADTFSLVIISLYINIQATWRNVFSV